MKCPVGPGHADTLCSFGAAHTARRPLFRHGAPRPGSDETGTFCGAVRCGAPACPQIAIPSFPAFTARHLPSPIPLPSPLPLPSPTSEPVHRPLAAALREFSRTCLSAPQGRRHHPQDPAHNNRNFLDLWQTIAQDLSRLFAMPGRCPSRPRSRKDWPALAPMRWAYGKGRPLSCLHRKSRARSASVARSLPESALRCLAGTRCTRRHGAETGTPFLCAAPPQHRGTGAGWLPGTLPNSHMDLDKTFWHGRWGSSRGKRETFSKRSPSSPSSHPFAAFKYSTRSYHGPADLAYP